jgi:hypothetical protein
VFLHKSFANARSRSCFCDRYGPNHVETARHLAGIGKAFKQLFDHEKALRCFSRALSIYSNNIGVMNLEVAELFTEMSMCLITEVDANSIEQAKVFRAWAVEVYIKCLGTHCETVCAVLQFGASMAANARGFHADGWCVYAAARRHGCTRSRFCHSSTKGIPLLSSSG